MTKNEYQYLTVEELNKIELALHDLAVAVKANAEYTRQLLEEEKKAGERIAVLERQPL